MKIEEAQKINTVSNIAAGILAKSIKFFIIIPLLIMGISHFIYPVDYLVAMIIQIFTNIAIHLIKIYRNDNTINRRS